MQNENRISYQAVCCLWDMGMGLAYHPAELALNLCCLPFSLSLWTGPIPFVALQGGGVLLVVSPQHRKLSIFSWRFKTVKKPSGTGSDTCCSIYISETYVICCLATSVYVGWHSFFLAHWNCLLLAAFAVWLYTLRRVMSHGLKQYLPLLQ